MGRITSLFVRKILQQADPSLDKRALLEPLGIDLDAPVDPSHMVPDTDYYAFLESIAREDPNALDLPLRTGESMRCDDYGAFGLAWKSAPNLRGSYERLARYALVLTSVAAYEVRDVDRGVLMLLHREGERRLGMRLSNEATIASIASVSQQASTQLFQPLEVRFKHPAPNSLDAHERFFGCPVHFATDHDGLLVSHEIIMAPNQLGDPSIVRFLDSHLDEALSKLEGAGELDAQVRIHISNCLSEGIPTIADIAPQLGMSGRTLQRRLSERGHSFQNLVDEARRQLAERLLRNTDYPLMDVAFLTGFSEQSSFTRAFKRWAGKTPRSYRLHVQA